MLLLFIERSVVNVGLNMEPRVRTDEISSGPGAAANNTKSGNVSQPT